MSISTTEAEGDIVRTDQRRGVSRRAIALPNQSEATFDIHDEQVVVAASAAQDAVSVAVAIAGPPPSCQEEDDTQHVPHRYDLDGEKEAPDNIEVLSVRLTDENDPCRQRRRKTTAHFSGGTNPIKSIRQ
jgi:hypothetical protein